MYQDNIKSVPSIFAYCVDTESYIITTRLHNHRVISIKTLWPPIEQVGI